MSFEEEDEIRTYHAAELVEQYAQRVGMKQIVAIAEASKTEQEILETILQQMELAEEEEMLLLRNQTIGEFST